MSAADLDSWVKLLGAMAGVLGAVTVLARTLLKWFPPRSVSLTAEMATMREEAATVKAELAAARSEIAALRQEMRLLTDYAHDLREHVALEKDPPPPDWPAGLRL